MRAKADLYAAEQRQLSDKVVAILGILASSSVIWIRTRIGNASY